jgi:hypothetical protein
VIFTVPDGGNDRARPQEIEQEVPKGFRSSPVATVALHGPDDTTATKLTVGIVPAEDAEAATFDAGFRRTRPTYAMISGWRKRCWYSSPRPEPSQLW